MNQPALYLFRFQVGRLWHRALSRRSQKGRVLGIACGASSLAGFLLPNPLSSLIPASHGRPHLRQEPDAGIRLSGSVEGYERS